MSYILEALKKAQAERQLGNAPTIHAPAPGHAAPASRAGRHPLILGAAAGAVVVALAVALGAAFLSRQPAPAPLVASAPAQMVAPASVPAPVPAPAAPAVAADAAAPAQPAQAPKPEAPPRARTAPGPAPARTEPPPAATELETAPPARVAAAPAAPPAAGEDVGTLQSLPESVRREIPQLSFGGYIYSPNPAERLLLVDKTLRREGEEVAPGLVLERLLPKAAILNYRGTRYRVGY